MTVELFQSRLRFQVEMKASRNDLLEPTASAANAGEGVTSAIQQRHISESGRKPPTGEVTIPGSAHQETEMPSDSAGISPGR